MISRTLNQAVNTIKDICSRHPMIKQYAFGQSLMEVDTSQIQTPYFYITPDPSTLQKNGLQMNLIFTCFDQLSEDFSNEQEVLSDTLQIIQDIITELDDFDTIDFQVNIENSFTITPFSHRFDSLTAGWWCSVQLQMAYPMSLCDSPVTKQEDISWLYNVTVSNNSPNSEISQSAVPLETLELYCLGTIGSSTTFLWTGPNGQTSVDRNPTLPAIAATSGVWTLIITYGINSRTLTTEVKLAK